MINAARPRFNVAWNNAELDSLRSAQGSLLDAVIRLVCADPMHQTAEERRNVVAYIKAMAVEISHEARDRASP